ncbi:hypothetical protein TEQG_01762 [Trichophyton equinum CBS 127.97]|uniref:Uncharacterized protein n=1 Tax=Trichophyton equinum (strain ATCC MYA-4606 / CBS 127.97) TaxID=559882 RepID=F2PLC8_TRIEC|nr:hypothetical protein TEQG_01762 [Trichophyton equinum CBS 127.97]
MVQQYGMWVIQRLIAKIMVWILRSGSSSTPERFHELACRCRSVKVILLRASTDSLLSSFEGLSQCWWLSSFAPSPEDPRAEISASTSTSTRQKTKNFVFFEQPNRRLNIELCCSKELHNINDTIFFLSPCAKRGSLLFGYVNQT